MLFSKIKVQYINELLNEIKDNREKFIDALIELCPKKGECDAQLETSKEAMKCEYFTLCNAMGSYSLMNEEERAQADEFLDELHMRMEARKNPQNTMYM